MTNQWWRRCMKQFLRITSFALVLQQKNANADRNLRGLIVNGVDAPAQGFQQYVKAGNDGNYLTPDTLCGGSLIHSDIILTAAHCQGAFNYGVLLYNSTTNDFSENVQIVQQYRFPDFNFNDDNIGYDVMVLVLGRPVYDITPVPLNSDPTVPFIGEMLTAVGFGRLSVDASSPANRLQKADFTCIDNDDCESRFIFANFDFGDDILCVDSFASTASSICQGDSGGPLYSLGSSGAVNSLVGVTSFTGNQCSGENKLPDGGFARVSTFHTWIQQRICALSVDRPNYCNTLPPEVEPNDLVARMTLRFQHDLSAPETTFAVKRVAYTDFARTEYVTLQVHHVGPIYVPLANEGWITRFYLPAGDFLFFVYDKGDDGLVSTFDIGWWELLVAYGDEEPDDLLVSYYGDDLFDTQITPFAIGENSTFSTPPSASPSEAPTLAPTHTPTHTFNTPLSDFFGATAAPSRLPLSCARCRKRQANTHRQGD